MMDNIDRLTAVEQIRKTKARYFRYVDAKDWTTWRTLFTDDLVVDASASSSAKLGDGDVISGADAFVAAVKEALSDIETIHHGHMGEIDVLGPDDATAVWAMQDWLYFGPTKKALRKADMMQGWGYYFERYRRVGDEWLICEWKHVRTRNEYR